MEIGHVLFGQVTGDERGEEWSEAVDPGISAKESYRIQSVGCIWLLIVKEVSDPHLLLNCEVWIPQPIEEEATNNNRAHIRHRCEKGLDDAAPGAFRGIFVVNCVVPDD